VKERIGSVGAKTAYIAPGSPWENGFIVLSTGYRAPAPEVFVRALAAWPGAQSPPVLPAMLSPAPRPTLN
jgi:putative transposase